MDPYRILGVPRDSTRDQVKAAFRARVSSTHPDRGGENADFVELHAAYERILAILDRRDGRKSACNQPQRPKDRDSDAAESVSPATNEGQQRQGTLARAERIKKKPESSGYPEAYLSWLTRVSDDDAHRDPRRRWKWLRRLGASYLLYMFFCCVIVVLLSVGSAIYESSQEPPRYVEQPRYEERSSKPEEEISAWQIVAIVAVLHAPLAIIFPIVCKFDDY